jgi:hypothetical protein
MERAMQTERTYVRVLRFHPGVVVTNRLIRGKVIATDGTLCKVEYNLWPGEPARTVWVDQDDLLPCDGMTIDQACAAADRARAA